MNDTQIKTFEQARQFLKGAAALDLFIDSKEDRYTWIQTPLVRFHYLQLSKADKDVLLSFLQKVSGYSRIQVKRLVKQYCMRGCIQRRQRTPHRFARQYTDQDIRLLARTDELHGTLSGQPLRSSVSVPGTFSANRRVSAGAPPQLAGISVAHLYNFNDNALVESKNGAIVRKHLGYLHIPPEVGTAHQRLITRSPQPLY